MSGINHESVEAARNTDLLTYLRENDPYELVRVSGSVYCTREHDSLRISNGKWYWFSRGFGGTNALDYLIKVKGYDFIEAAKLLAGMNFTLTRTESVKEPVIKPKNPEMPVISERADIAAGYLMKRGISPGVIDYCLEHNLVFETKKHHNVMFVGYDRNGMVRFAAVRGTDSGYKGNVSGSDKRYSFCVNPGAPSGCLHVFEAAIDAMSYMTLMEMEGKNWHEDSFLSLSGVYANGKDDIPAALERYLEDYPEISEIRLHLDADEVGRGAAFSIQKALERDYEVYDEPPVYGKDINDDLIEILRCERIEEEYER